jgi:PST family polysaccharide transporter
MAERPGLRAVLANTSWLAGDKIIRMGVGLLVGVLIARALGPADFGVLSSVSALLSLFVAVGALGLDSVTVREFVDNPDDTDSVAGTVFVLKLGGSAIATLCGVAAAALLRPADPREWHVAAAIGVGQLFLAFDAIDYWFQSRLQSRHTVVARTAAFLIVSAVRVVILWRGATLYALAWAISLESILAACGMLLVYRREAPGRLRRWRVRVAIARELLSRSWPLAFSGLVVAVYMRLDQVMLAHMSGDTEVGIYSVAVRLAELWYFLPTAVATSTLPALLRSRTASPAVYDAQIRRIFVWMAGAGYVVAIGLTLLARPVVELLYGAAYRPAVPSLIVLAWTGIFVCLGVARENWMLAEGHMRLSLATTAIGALVNTVLNVFLIPVYGAVGAALATLIAQLFAVCLSTAFFPPTRPVFLMQLHALTLGLAQRRRVNP